MYYASDRPFVTGARLAFSKYPGVSLLRKLLDSARLARIERDCQRLYKTTGGTVIVSSDGKIHNPLIHYDTSFSASVCGVCGDVQKIEMGDYSKQWCVVCWPGIQRSLNRYRVS